LGENFSVIKTQTGPGIWKDWQGIGLKEEVRRKEVKGSFPSFLILLAGRG